MERLGPREEIWRGLLYGQRSMMLRLTATLKREFGLSAAQFEALLTLWEAGDPMPMTQLGRGLLYSSGSTTNLVARLEERGLVLRTPDPEDARVVMVALTAEGTELFVRAQASHLAELEACFAPLVPEVEVDPLLAFARRLAAAEGVTTQWPRR